MYHVLNNINYFNMEDYFNEGKFESNTIETN